MKKWFVAAVLGAILTGGLAVVPRVMAALVAPADNAWQVSEHHSSQPWMRATLHPSKDNTLYEDDTGSLSNGTGAHLFVGNTDNELARRAVIAFDVAGGIPAGSTVVSATLRLYMSRSNSVGQTVTLHRLLADWGEGNSNAPDNEGAGTSATTGSATWLHTFFRTDFWATPGGDFSPAASATTVIGGLGFYTWGSTAEVVADVQSWLDNPETNFGWLLLGNESTWQTTKRFDSRESFIPAGWPVLIIDYLAQAGGDVSIGKTAGVDIARSGQTITYTYQVTNTGTLPLASVHASDDKLGAVALDRTTLAPGETASGMLAYTVADTDLPGPLVNSVTVSGTVSGPPPVEVVTATAQASVKLSDLAIYLPAVHKRRPAPSVQAPLGRAIFFDENLSINQNLSCASCHAPEVGWSGPDSDFNAHGAVYEGSIAGRFGDRRPPSAAYLTVSPIFHEDETGQFVGGNFWDGRATGEKLGNPAADQAQGPFLNPVEQALPDSACVVYRVCNAGYPVSFESVWGPQACDIDWPADVEAVCATEGVTVALSPEDRAKSDRAFDNIGLSIAAFEGSDEVNAFSSRYDYYLKGMAELTAEQQLGLTLFQSKGKCHKCHIEDGPQPLFTNFTFDNLGIPQNPENPAGMAPEFVDPGLGGFLKSAGYPQEVYEAEWGKFKAPTLRNLDVRPEPGFVKAFGHNGYFKTLKGIVHFYNTRDVKPVCPGPYTEAQALAADCWPAPEVAENINTAEMGDLGLTAEEEDAIVAFMQALSDGYRP